LDNWFKIGVLVAICLIPLFIVPVLGQEMKYFENELYEFSFNIPTGWIYRENIQYPNVPISLVEIFPPDAGTIFPIVGVQYEHVPQSRVPNLNDKEVENYISEEIRILLPNIGKITSSSIESRSWGWIVTTEYF